MKAYSNPYLAGAGIGLALLAAIVLAGRGLGASGAFASVLEVPRYGAEPLTDWLVLELAAVMVGGFASAIAAGRFHIGIERGAHISNRTRLLAAFGGGTVMGVGARLARGCTSGLGLTGGALLSAGSWLFVMAAFAGAYALAPVVRRLWQ